MVSMWRCGNVLVHSRPPSSVGRDESSNTLCETWFATEQERILHRQEFLCYDADAERNGVMSETVVLVTGPRWWGDPSVDRHNESITVGSQKERVESERLGVDRFLDSLPEGTLVMHGAARGLDVMVASQAQLRGFPVASVPYFQHLGKRGGPERNHAMIAMVNGLVAAGWKAKVVAFTPEHGEYEAKGTLGCAKSARSAGLHVQFWHPVHPDTDNDEGEGE